MDKVSKESAERVKRTQEKFAQARKLQAVQSHSLVRNTQVKSGNLAATSTSNYANTLKSVNHISVEGAIPVLELRLRSAVVNNVIDYFSEQMSITDYRQSGKVRFSAQSLVFTVMLSYLCGYRSACAMGIFWKRGYNFLRASISDFPKEIVSHDTIKRSLENVIFENFHTFYSRFITRLIYESLNDLHIHDNLSSEFSPLFRAALQEQNESTSEEKKDIALAMQLVQKQVYDNLVNIEHLSQEQALSKIQQKSHQFQSAQYRIYRLFLYGCSARLNKRSFDEIEEIKEKSSILSLIRTFEVTGCAKQIHFYLDDYNVPPPSNNLRRTM